MKGMLAFISEIYEMYSWTFIIAKFIKYSLFIALLGPSASPAPAQSRISPTPHHYWGMEGDILFSFIGGQYSEISAILNSVLYYLRACCIYTQDDSICTSPKETKHTNGSTTKQKFIEACTSCKPAHD
jgi:hypothetical protein